MNKLRFPLAFASVALLAGCGSEDPSPSEPRNAAAAAAPAAGQAGNVHSAEGDVIAVTNTSVSLSHGPIASAGWSAMTMTFDAPPGLAAGINVGDPVAFSFAEKNGRYELTSIRKV